MCFGLPQATQATRSFISLVGTGNLQFTVFSYLVLYYYIWLLYFNRLKTEVLSSHMYEYLALDLNWPKYSLDKCINYTGFHMILWIHECFLLKLYIMNSHALTHLFLTRIDNICKPYTVNMACTTMKYTAHYMYSTCLSLHNILAHNIIYNSYTWCAVQY